MAADVKFWRGEIDRSLPSRVPLAPVRTPVIGESEYFRAHPEVAAMATEDNHVTFNPFVEMSDADKHALRLNESARIAMTRRGYKPTSPLTDAQRKTVAGWGGPYAADETLARQTAIARIISGDESLAPYSSSQQQEAQSFSASPFPEGADLLMNSHGPSRLSRNPRLLRDALLAQMENK